MRFDTEAAYREFLVWYRTPKADRPPFPGPVAKRSKWNNTICKADGFTFDSLVERAHYYELRILEKAGKVRNLRVHPRYKFVSAAGLAIRTYEADFVYEELVAQAWVSIVEDVKNPANAQDAKFRKNCKLMLQFYEITVRVTIR